MYHLKLEKTTYLWNIFLNLNANIGKERCKPKLPEDKDSERNGNNEVELRAHNKDEWSTQKWTFNSKECCDNDLSATNENECAAISDSVHQDAAGETVLVRKTKRKNDYQEILGRMKEIVFCKTVPNSSRTSRMRTFY